MQEGSVIQTSRKGGPNVWEFRWSEKDRNGRRKYRRRVIGTVGQYEDAVAVRHAASALIAEVNLRSHKKRVGAITVDQLCEHFEQRELLPGTSLGVEFKVMQELMRHSSLRSTLDVYTQAVGPAKRAAQTAVLSLFAPWPEADSDCEIIGTA
jgi:hypothetical protein